ERGRADVARAVVDLEHAIQEEAARVGGLPEPVAECVEDGEELLRRMTRAARGLRLEPAVDPELRVTVQGRDDQRVLRGEVTVERRLRDTGFGHDAVDADG